MGKEKDYGCIPDIAVLLVNVVALAVALISAISVGIITNDSISDSIEADLFTQLYQAPLPVPPTYFTVPATAVTPVKDQGSRGTCWVFSTLGLAEGSYRANGYAKGFLKEDEYVLFSEQAYGLGVCDYCNNNNEDPYCFGGPLDNDTADGRGEWLYYFRDKPSCRLLPDDVCPYKPKQEDQYDCPNRLAALEKNPISFKVTAIDSAYSIDGIRSALFKYKQPLLWSHGVFDATYTVSCEADEWKDSDMCKKKMFPCGENNDKFCAKYVTKGYNNQGLFYLHNEPYSSSGHAMLIVGYNDNFRVDTGAFGDLKARTLGGFIIKNSWGAETGHSMKYWSQEISSVEEAGLCPCENSSSTWLPIDSECMKTTVGAIDPLLCSPDYAYKFVRDTWKVGSTVLKCSGISEKNAAFFGYSGCQTDRYYALAQAPLDKVSYSVWTLPPVGSVSEGNVRFTLVSWPKVDPTNDQVEIIVTNDSTWDGIERIFTPVDMSGNDTDMCGYWFIPYEYFQEGNIRYQTSGHDTPEVSFMNIEWDDQSYLANKNNKNNKNNNNNNKQEGELDYSLLENSRRTQKLYQFDGPLDFDTLKNGSEGKELLRRRKAERRSLKTKEQK